MRNTMSIRTLVPWAVIHTESPGIAGRLVLPVLAAVLRPIRTWAAQVSNPAGIRASFPLVGNASLISIQIGMLIAGGAPPSIKATEMLSKYVPTLSPVVGEQVTDVRKNEKQREIRCR